MGPRACPFGIRLRLQGWRSVLLLLHVGSHGVVQLEDVDRHRRGPLANMMDIRLLRQIWKVSNEFWSPHGATWCCWILSGYRRGICWPQVFKMVPNLSSSPYCPRHCDKPNAINLQFWMAEILTLSSRSLLVWFISPPWMTLKRSANRHRPESSLIHAQWRYGQIAVVGPPKGQAGDDGRSSAAAQPVQGLSVFCAEDLHHLRMPKLGGSAADYIFLGKCYCSLMCLWVIEFCMPFLYVAFPCLVFRPKFSKLWKLGVCGRCFKLLPGVQFFYQHPNK